MRSLIDTLLTRLYQCGTAFWNLGITLSKDILHTAVILGTLALILFAVTGIWPPMVAIESGSMEPNIDTGDLVVIVAPDRFVADASHHETGVVSHDGADTHEAFNKPGDVIVFQPNGDANATPVIHRAIFWVEEGEDWYDRADDARLVGDSCSEVTACPAPHDGFITRGDANEFYDQSNAANISEPVAADWIQGKAVYNIPRIGEIRLHLQTMLDGQPAATSAE